MSAQRILDSIEKSQRRQATLPEFRPGDSIKVWAKIREGEKTRLQAFEGVCIRRVSKGSRSTFTVRKISYGVGVERIFPDNSPNIDKIEVIARGRVHQARLYYLRDLSGKAARIKEREGTGEARGRGRRGRRGRGRRRRGRRSRAEGAEPKKAKKDEEEVSRARRCSSAPLEHRHGRVLAACALRRSSVQGRSRRVASRCGRSCQASPSAAESPAKIDRASAVARRERGRRAARAQRLSDRRAELPCKVGELDVVARDGDVLVFVEVRSRADGEHGSARRRSTAEAAQVARVAMRTSGRRRPVRQVARFDVVAITGDEDRADPRRLAALTARSKRKTAGRSRRLSSRARLRYDLQSGYVELPARPLRLQHAFAGVRGIARHRRRRADRCPG